MSESRSALFKWLLWFLILTILSTLVYVQVVRPAQRIKQLESNTYLSLVLGNHLPDWVPDTVADNLFRYVKDIEGEFEHPPIQSLRNHRKLEHINSWKLPPQIDLRGCVKLEVLEILGDGSCVMGRGLPSLWSATVTTPGPEPSDLRDCPKLYSLRATGPILLDGCNALQQLRYTGRTPPPAEDWKSLTNLRSLEIRGNIDGELVETFPPLPHPERLETLYFSGSMLASNVPWPSLTGLKTVYIDGVVAPGELDLRPCANLHEVVLSDPAENTRVWLPASVEQVQLWASHTTNLAPSPYLHFEVPCRELWIGEATTIIDLPEDLLIGLEFFGAERASSLSDEVWQKLAEAPKLKKLELHLASEDIPALDGFPALRELNVTEDTTVTIKQAPALERIYRESNLGRTVQDVSPQPDGPPVVGPERTVR